MIYQQAEHHQAENPTNKWGDESGWEKELDAIEVGLPGNTKLVSATEETGDQVPVSRLETHDPQMTRENAARALGRESAVLSPAEISAETRDVLALLEKYTASARPGDQILKIERNLPLAGEKFLVKKSDESEITALLEQRGYLLRKVPHLGFRAEKGPIDFVFIFGQEK